MKTYHSRDTTWLGSPYWSPSKDKGSGNALPQEAIIPSDAGSEYIDESNGDEDYIPAITGIVDSEDEEEE